MVTSNIRHKVAHLTSVHARYDTRIFLKMCCSLANEGLETTLIVADGNGDEIKEGVSIVDVGARTGGRLSRVTKTVSQVYKKAVDIDADIYHLHDPELLLIAKKLKKLGKRVIFDAHEDLPLQILSKVYLNPIVARSLSFLTKKYENYVCRFIDAVVTATPYIRDKFLLVNSKSIDINNFPIINELTKLSTLNFEQRNSACYIGGITKVRGIEEIIDSLSLLSSKTQLLLAGNFSEPKLQRDISLRQGWSKVSFQGWLNRDDVKHVLQNSFVGLVTLHPTKNYKDALPVKMFEYMAAGVPVIYSNIPLWKGIIGEFNCGISVDPYNPKDIADAIDYFANNLEEAQMMGARGREAVQEKYNWSIEEKKLIELYKGLLN